MMGKLKGRIFQLHLAFASSFGMAVMGLLKVWPSYTAGIYTSNSTTPLSEPMTTAEESLLGSLPSLGAVLGTAITGFLINKLGRKIGGVVISLPFVISWTMISLTTSKTVVLAARFISGISGGSFLVYGPIFISEVAEDSFRGTLASGPILMYVTGIMLSYIVGWMLSYRIIIWINVGLSIGCTLLIMSVKESPVFLLKQKRQEEARAAIAHYRGSSPSTIVVQHEFSRLQQQLIPTVKLISVTGETQHTNLGNDEAEKAILNKENVDLEEQNQIPAVKHLFVSPSSRRAFLVVITVISLQVLMGLVSVQVYAKTVFTQTDPSKADLYTVVFALVLMCGSFVTTVVADKAGRRVLIITSSILVCLCMTTLGYLLQTRIAPPWVTVLCIMLYCFSFMFGAATVPYLLLAEVFVKEVQSLASMIIVEWVWFLNFFIIGVFPYMNSLFGIHGTFYFFACMAIINAIISYFFVPETKGLSNEQIQEVFLRRKQK